MIGLYACLLTLGLLLPALVPGGSLINIEKREGVMPDSIPPDTALSAAFPDSIFFGEVGIGYCKDTTISVRLDALPGPFVTLTAFSGAGQYSVTPDTVMGRTITDQDTSLVFTIRFCPQGAREISGIVAITDSGEISRTITLKGTGRQTGLPFGGNDTIDMGEVQPGEGADTTGYIGRGDIPFVHIHNVRFLDTTGPFMMLAPLRPDSLHIGRDSMLLRVRVMGGILGSYDIPLEIRTSAGVRTIRFLVNVQREPPPPPDSGRVTVGAELLDFGEVVKGGFKELTFKVTNTREDPVPLLQKIHDADAPFRIQPESDSGIIVPAHDSVTITIRYTPPDSGSHQGFDSLMIGGTPHMPSILLLGRSYLGLSESVPFEIDFDTLHVGNCQQRTFTFPYRDAAIMEQVRLALDSVGFRIVSPTSPVVSGDSLVLTVEFCPERRGVVNDTIIGETGIRPSVRSFVIRVRGEGRAGLLGTSAPQIDFNTVDVGDCEERDIVLTNIGNGWTRLTESELSNLLGADGPFSIDPPDLSHSFAPGSSITIRVRFCPDSAITFTGRWNGSQQYGGALRVDLRGQGRRDVVAEGWRVSLDTATIRVGDTARLTLSIREALDPSAGVRFDSARIIVNRRSLLPLRVIPPVQNGDGARGVFGARGRMIDSTTYLITGERGGEPISGSGLFTIEFLGLSTGERENVIRIESVGFAGLRDVRIGENGYVILEGCDLEQAGAFTRRVAIKAIVTDPNASAVTISYDAPEGSTPVISLIDLSGKRVLSNELPGGTGQEQSAHVELTGVAPGFYLLELRVADDVTTARVVVGE